MHDFNVYNSVCEDVYNNAFENVYSDAFENVMMDVGVIDGAAAMGDVYPVMVDVAAVSENVKRRM